jgi:transposase
MSDQSARNLMLVHVQARDKTSAVISPMAFQAVQKFDAVFALERSINGLPLNKRLAARRREVVPLVKDLVDWMTRERAKLSRHNDAAKAMDYMLTRLDYGPSLKTAGYGVPRSC